MIKTVVVVVVVVVVENFWRIEPPSETVCIEKNARVQATCE